MATKTQKPEGAAAPELVPIDKLREQHKVGRATYAGVCAANGWRPGTVIGDVAEVQLVDKDGDIIASAGERVFTKTPGKGLYIAFKYNILEVEVESSNESL